MRNDKHLVDKLLNFLALNGLKKVKGIVFTSSKDQSDSIIKLLEEKGKRAVGENKKRAWQSEGARILVIKQGDSAILFRMKQIRYIIHLTPPSSINLFYS